MMSLSGSSGRTIERPPFTPTQWQELEHQALIYKYMVSGVPVPPELIFSIRRSLDSSLVSRLLPHQSLGWGCYQMGFGRKPDPEPGRCRRTDGKKWRCSREAYPDSKYCEKHMHRGRNRARKSLDQNQNQTTTTTTAGGTTTTTPSLSFPNTSPTLSSSSSYNSASMDAYTNRFGQVGGSSSSNNYTRGYFNDHYNPYPSTSPKQQQQQPLHHASALSLHQNTSTNSQFNLLANTTTDHKDFRYFQGIGERVGGVGERTFFPEASRSTFQDSPYHHHQQPLSTMMNDPYHHCSTTTDHHNNTYSSSSSSHHHHHDNDHHRQQQQQCFVLGADMFNKPTRTVLANRQQQEEEEEKDSSETKKSLHHFFGEDWAQNKTSSDSWLDLSSHSRLDTGS